MDVFPPGTTDIGIALAVIWYLVKEIVRLVKGDPMLKMVEELKQLNAVLSQNQAKVNEVHEWMKPNYKGVQSWKDTTLIQSIKQDLTVLFTRLHEYHMDRKDTFYAGLEKIFGKIEALGNELRKSNN